MHDYPTVEIDVNDWLSKSPEPGTFMLTSQLPADLLAHANIAVRERADYAVVFLPGAQNFKAVKQIPFFHRWTWHHDLPDAHVIALSDPAIATYEKAFGGWFLHPQVDIIERLAELVGQITTHLGIAPDRVVFHGSSLGGFGAIGMAAHLRGASAVSEIPQTDVSKWPFPGSIAVIGHMLGMPLSELHASNPERVEVIERLRHAKFVPPFTLVTNTADQSYDLQMSFMDEVAELSRTTETLGSQRVMVTDVVTGHQPLPKPAALELLHAAVSV